MLFLTALDRFDVIFYQIWAAFTGMRIVYHTKVSNKSNYL
jgi:hypothetical protein